MPYSGASFDSRYEPTNSHVSPPSKLPIVTSKSDFVVFLHQVVFLLKSSDFFACMMIFFSLSVIVSYCEANVKASLSNSSEIDG